jgi:hypothetical protein
LPQTKNNADAPYGKDTPSAEQTDDGDEQRLFEVFLPLADLDKPYEASQPQSEANPMGPKVIYIPRTIADGW